MPKYQSRISDPLYPYIMRQKAAVFITSSMLRTQRPQLPSSLIPSES
ncbi:hypothetical protein CLOSTHATH_01387 [Hungatella hathewayi DSM 13479]|uniref:Uncharacterized protein n=1 Tax=Hungatella hathewayi DSM 13479 TaxID=566550 RepID=D3ACQ9_9FIRM|nr:hypothetical protein CLOSTHATH_01387 [Hungatella hathewayi DSM 13479]